MAEDGGLGLVSEVDDGGFESEFAGATIEDIFDLIVEARFYVSGAGGADVGEGVSAGGCEGKVDVFFYELSEDGVLGGADGYGREAGGNFVGDGRFFGEDNRERARPESCGELAGSFVGLAELIQDFES